MSLQLEPDGAMTDEPLERHLELGEIAAFVDRVATGEEQARIASHLAECAECRAEFVDASRIVAGASRARAVRRKMWIPATAAAAAVVLLLAWPRSLREPGVQMAHREGPVTATVAPRALAPIGAVDSVASLTWSAVPLADRYQVRLFDADGSVIWERDTPDTTISVPTSIRLPSGRAFYWKVEAQTGFARRAASELIEFSIRQSRAP